MTSSLLVIEDRPAVAEQLGRRFRRLGVEHVQVVTEPTKAIGAVLSRAWDGITIDLAMDDIAGPILWEMIRDVDPHAAARVWYLTSHTMATAAPLIVLAEGTGRPIYDKGDNTAHKRIAYTCELRAAERRWSRLHRQAVHVGDDEGEQHAARHLARIVRDRQTLETVDAREE